MIFLIDGNWYLHRVFYTTVSKRSFEKALIHNFLSLVCKDALALRAKKLLVCFDGPKVFRYKIYKDYKANRHKGKEGGDIQVNKDVYEYLEPLLSVMTAIKMPWIQPPTYEADDALCSGAYKYKEVICGTKDKDSYQYLNKSVSLYDSSNKINGEPHPKIITYKDVQTKVLVSQMVDYQTLIGDAIDNIPRIVAPAKAKNILSKHKTLANALRSKEYDDILLPELENLKRNRKLVKLCNDVPLPELDSINFPRTENEFADLLPKSYYSYQEFIHPRSRGLW